MYLGLFNHSPIVEYLGYFQFVAIMYNVLETFIDSFCINIISHFSSLNVQE